MFGSRSIGFASILAVLLGTCVAPRVGAQVIVVPNALATTDGNSFNDTLSGATGPLRFMQIFDASQFAALSGPAFLTQIAQRPDTLPDLSGPRTFTVSLFASTTTRSVAGLSSTFSDNIGANNTLLFSGMATLVTANLPGPGNTRQFDIFPFGPFTSAFLYDPAAGNLLLDAQIASGSGLAIRRDAVMGDLTTRSLGAVGSATAVTGTLSGIGNVTQFTFQPVPEPTSIALLSLGACGVLGSAWRRRKHAGRAAANY